MVNGMIALKSESRKKLLEAIRRDGVVATVSFLRCDEQTMMRAAVGVPLRDDVARRINETVEGWA